MCKSFYMHIPLFVSYGASRILAPLNNPEKEEVTMEQATKDQIAVVGKEALKIGIAVAAGVAAYKLY